MIINKFTCEFNGKTRFFLLTSIRPFQPIPISEFSRPLGDGRTFKMTWVDDSGEVIEAEKTPSVEWSITTPRQNAEIQLAERQVKSED
jgi:hypothetical protein